MHGHDLAVSAAENYRAFAEDARGRSPAYECLAGSVAEDAAVLRFLGTLPPEKRQPNLLFAAARYLLGAPADITGLRALIRQNSAELAGVMMARRTQTNEPARCATLLPALAQLPPPLAPFDLVAAQSTAINEDDGLVTAVAMASLVAAGRGGRNALRTARAARLALCRPRFLSQSGE